MMQVELFRHFAQQYLSLVQEIKMIYRREILFSFVDRQAHIAPVILKAVERIFLCGLLLAVIVFGPKSFYLGTLQHQRMQFIGTFFISDINYESQEMLS